MGNMVWKILGTGSALLAASLARKGAMFGWEKATGREAPASASADDSDLREAIMWALVSGAVVGVARMLAERESAKYFTQSTGHSPDVYEQDED